MTTTAIRERPILFSALMVRAILEGRKTVTRRVVKPQPEHGIAPCHYVAGGWAETDGNTPEGCRCNNGERRCPYGRVGDRLWVRETWARSRNNWLYAADAVVSEGPQGNTDDWDWDASIANRWRPSIHMPRAASRITLEITGVRVERVQEIENQDAKAEGFVDPSCTRENMSLARDAFLKLWDTINGNRPGCSWSDNPWVWCIEFKRIGEPT
jgi:hypothetical protein